MRIAWLTDIHLDHLSAGQREAFYGTVVAVGPDAVLVGGDIGHASTFRPFLRELADAIRRPVYFVLGNHDYYGGAISEVRGGASELARISPCLRWLPEAGVVRLAEGTALLGHGSWADGRLGAGARSTVLLNDYLLIRDFIPLDQAARFRKLNELGDEAARSLAEVLPRATSSFPRILLLTHVPPFREACWHEGRTSDDDWLPHFACRAVGEVLLEVMRAHPGSSLTVLCGHTHSPGEALILENLRVITGGAVYGAPRVQAVFEVE
jgi:3',5'-cyclic AMP phosphodiesterase CpdA